jgi:hypothetical protein
MLHPDPYQNFHGSATLRQEITKKTNIIAEDLK